MRIISRLFVLFILSLAMVACSNDSQTLLSEENEQGKKEVQNKIIFGEKTGEKELKARNLFKLGETTHFLVTLESPVEANQVTIVLNKFKDDQWTKLTEAPLEVKPEWKQFLNGLPGSLYEQTGPGAYQMIAYKGEEELAKGEFVVEKKKDGSSEGN